MSICLFNSTDRMDWIRDITRFREECLGKTDLVVLRFGQAVSVESMSPEMFVSLACLIEAFARDGINVKVDRHTQVGELLYTKHQFREYWAGGKDYAAIQDDSILNLQRINEAEKDLYGLRVSEFLKSRYFKSKDMTPVSSSITEAYYNIFDHAEADGNAFSMLSLDADKAELRVAVCDFGVGISKTVRDFLGQDISDVDAIHKAMEDRFTVKSSSHNGGFGLRNILNCCTEKDVLWIVSNRGAVAANAFGEHRMSLDFDFKGTLLFYKMSISHFDNEQVLEDFNW